MTERIRGFYWVISEPGRQPSVAQWNGTAWLLFGAVTSWTQDRVEKVGQRFLPADPPTVWLDDG